ncbi:MAG: nucleotidyl transferase AbiEii/AbiGii toxin family protein [Bacteroidales bacterium]|nr:nucleotidyl transferase AbiEii/AbiGii toxin family protein [Bacteroidales bacterium]
MTVFDEMVEALHPRNKNEKENAQQEVMQQIALYGLYRGGFFDHAAFYGGTCLRIFHNLQRYSEDMDFTQTEKDPNIHLETYFPQIIEAFKLTGREVTIKKKEKKTFGKVESAYDIAFQTEKTIKVKIELDTDPPLGFETEQKTLLKPFSTMIRCVTLPDLYAGKMHALLYRNWKTRVKGRDWYDFQWYVANRVPLNFEHLQKRVAEFNGIELSKEGFLEALRERLAKTDIESVKKDAARFVFNQRDIDIWSNDFFLQLADMIVFKDSQSRNYVNRNHNKNDHRWR